MTLVAAISPGGHPVLVGDLVVSAFTDASPTVHLPGAGTLAGGYATPFGSIIGLRQKLVVLSPNLAFGWAGTEIVARSLLKGMKRAFGSSEVSPMEVYEHLDGLGLPEMPQAALVGLCIKGGQLHRFFQQADVIESETLGKIHIAGSGKEHFLAHATGARQLEKDGEFSGLDHAVSSVLMYSALPFISEMDTRSTLDSLYGGGFEFVTAARDPDGVVRLQKVGPITYMFWIAADDRSRLTLYPVIINFRYEGDNLLVTRAVTEDIKAGGVVLHAKQVMTHVIGSALNPSTAKEVQLVQEMPNMTPQFLVSYVVGHKNGRRLYQMILKKGCPLPVRFRSSATNLELDIEPAFVQELLSRL